MRQLSSSVHDQLNQLSVYYGKRPFRNGDIYISNVVGRVNSHRRPASEDRAVRAAERIGGFEQFVELELSG